MKKFQIKNGWIIMEHDSSRDEYYLISMKLSDVCMINVTKRDTSSFSINPNCIKLYGSSQEFEISYLENELEELDNDFKKLQELIFKLN